MSREFFLIVNVSCRSTFGGVLMSGTFLAWHSSRFSLLVSWIRFNSMPSVLCLFPAQGLISSAWMTSSLCVFFSSLGTRVTVTQCCRLCISAGRSGRMCWRIKSSRRRRRTFSPVWPTSSTASPRRRRRWAWSLPRSSSHVCGRRMVRELRDRGLAG